MHPCVLAVEDSARVRLRLSVGGREPTADRYSLVEAVVSTTQFFHLAQQLSVFRWRLLAPDVGSMALCQAQWKLIRSHLVRGSPCALLVPESGQFPFLRETVALTELADEERGRALRYRLIIAQPVVTLRGQRPRLGEPVRATPRRSTRLIVRCFVESGEFKSVELGLLFSSHAVVGDCFSEHPGRFLHVLLCVLLSLLLQALLYERLLTRLMAAIHLLFAVDLALNLQ